MTSEQINELEAHYLDSPLIDISATDVRARVRAGQSIRYLVPEPVREAIEARGLYRGAPIISHFRELQASRGADDISVESVTGAV